MKTTLLALLLTFVCAPSWAATDYKKECVIAQKYENDPNPNNRVNMSEWIKAQVEQIGFLVWQDKLDYAVDVGSRPFVFLVDGDPNNCEIVGFMLNSLQRMRAQRNTPEGVTFIFSKSSGAYKKHFNTKVVLKEYNLTEDEVKNHSARIFSEWIRFDQNPKTFLAIGTLTKSMNKLRKELKKVIDESELDNFRDNLKKIQSNSQTWALEKLYSAHGNLQKLDSSGNIQNLNQKIEDFQEHLVLYDQVRRGLWDKAQQTFQKIPGASQGLKDAMAKGRGNIEGILKVIRSDTQGLEKEIRQCFKESKDVVEHELKDAT